MTEQVPALPAIEDDVITTRAELFSMFNEHDGYRSYTRELGVEDTSLEHILPGFSDCQPQLNRELDGIFSAFNIGPYDWLEALVPDPAVDNVALEKLKQQVKDTSTNCGTFTYGATIRALEKAVNNGDHGEQQRQMTYMLEPGLSMTVVGSGCVWGTSDGLGRQVSFSAVFTKLH